MASYPGAKVHRSSRRKLGRGQSVQRSPATVTPVATTSSVALTFDVPVVVSGNIPLNLDPAVALLSQVQTDARHVTQTYAATVVGSDWSITAAAPVRTTQGGGLTAASGTF